MRAGMESRGSAHGRSGRTGGRSESDKSLAPGRAPKLGRARNVQITVGATVGKLSRHGSMMVGTTVGKSRWHDAANFFL